MHEPIPAWATNLPTVNAGLNALTTILLLIGYRFIRRGQRQAHRRTMLSAFGAATLFIAGYLTYHYFAGATAFGHHGAWVRTAYMTVLLSHTILATLAAPLAIVVLTLALRSSFDRHRRLARIVFPIWLYVSVTGVIVYVMLYHWPGASG